MLSRVITLAALALGGLAVHPVAGAALIPDDQEKVSIKDEKIVALEAKNVELEAEKASIKAKNVALEAEKASIKEEVVALKAQLKKVHRAAAHKCNTTVPSSSPTTCKVRSAAETRTSAPARTVAIALLAMTT